MCGIIGIVTNNKKRFPTQEIENMLDSMSHRGPNGEGRYFDKNLGIAMRRLSIIDLSSGDQPLYNEDKSIIIVGNGEIYNYKSLNKLLIGHKFKSKSDIETLVHLYEQLGLDFLKKVRGMFAFALYDKKKSKLILARDRAGEKPIYYSAVKRGFIFASELKSMLVNSWIDKSPNLRAFDSYFFHSYIPEPQTAFKGIEKLKRGHYLVLDTKKLTFEITKYWDEESIESINKSKPTQQIKKMFLQACKRTLVSDVPVGIALSGGIDSGAILSMAAPEYKKNMIAFSVGYEGTPPTDERKYAKELCEKYKVKFVERELTDKEIVNNFPNIIKAIDDPIADISSQSLYTVCQMAREHNTPVVLSGLGGDELFWGYPWVRDSILMNTNSKEPGETRRFYFEDLHRNFVKAKQFTEMFYSKKYSSLIANENRIYYAPKATFASKLEVARYTDKLLRDNWLVSSAITLTDRLSMANSIEMRAPFLDADLQIAVRESVLAMTGYEKGSKYWFKKAMKGILPNEVMKRKKKGFTPPVARWLFKIFVKYIHYINNGFLIKEGIIEPWKLKLLLYVWPLLPIYWYQIYHLLVLEIWGRLRVYDEAIA